MKPGNVKLLTIVGFVLAVVTVIATFFLFYRKESKTPREVARETAVQPTASGNSSTAQTPETKEVYADEEEPQAAAPIPFTVKTDSSKAVKDQVQFIYKSHYLPSQPNCDDYAFSWEEINLPDKQVTDLLNKAIREEVKQFEEIAAERTGIPGEFCNEEGEYEFAGTLAVFGNYLYAHYYSFIFFRGAAYPSSNLETTLFDLKTGKKINFHQLIKPNRIAELDSLVVTKPAIFGDNEVNAELSQAFRKQLPDLNFEFSKNGLVVIVNGINHATTRLTLDLDMEETAYFLKPEIFEMVYKKPNSLPR